MDRPRDSQRERLYRAESALPGSWRNTIGTNADAQAYVDSIITSRWFRQRWTIPAIRVAPGRTRGVSYGGVITLAPTARNPMVILHEIAHEALTWHTPGGSEVASHGPQFAATHLLLVRHFIGDAAAQALIEQYKGAPGAVPRPCGDGATPAPVRGRDSAAGAAAEAGGGCGASRGAGVGQRRHDAAEARDPGGAWAATDCGPQARLGHGTNAGAAR